MIFANLVLSLAAATAVLAAPTSLDVSVLQFALTLEHLENAFYSGALGKFDKKAFENEGFAPSVRGRLEQISQHEASHVAFLQGALGSAATQPCEYKFPYTDPRSFVDLAMALEGVGGAAYLGAASLITDKGVLTDAASILAVEHRHEGWVSSAALKIQPWDGAYETPLTPSGVFSLASAFITSCPASNPALPVKKLPTLTVSCSEPTGGDPLVLAYEGQALGSASTVAAFFTGLDVIFTNITDGSTVVPNGLHGTVYVGVASSTKQPFTDDQLVSGLEILQFPFGSGPVMA